MAVHVLKENFQADPTQSFVLQSDHAFTQYDHAFTQFVK